MKDEKNNIINSIAYDLLQDGLSGELVEKIRNLLFMHTADYEISRKETAIVVANPQEQNCIKMFLVAKKVEGCSDKTIYYYSSEIRKFFDKVCKSVKEVTSDDIRLYIAMLGIENGVSKTTQDNVLRILRSLFNWLSAEEYITKNPVTKIKRIKQDKIQKRAFSEIEIEKLRAGARNERERAMIDVLLSTGCRISELAGINRTEIHDGQTVVHGKGGKDRTVYFNAKAIVSIEAYLRTRDDDNIALFVTDSKPHNRLKVSGFEIHLRELGRELGINNVHPHRFRRTAATLAMKRGMPVELIRQMLGHANIETTFIYLDMNESDLANQHKKYMT